MILVSDVKEVEESRMMPKFSSELPEGRLDIYGEKVCWKQWEVGEEGW